MGFKPCDQALGRRCRVWWQREDGQKKETELLLANSLWVHPKNGLKVKGLKDLLPHEQPGNGNKNFLRKAVQYWSRLNPFPKYSC